MAKRKSRSDDTSSPSKKITISRRVTRSMTTEASRKAMLNTTELLENVLVHLPARQLFTIQRISRQFKEAVQKSPTIQRKMYFHPTAPRERWKQVLVPGSLPSFKFFPEASVDATLGPHDVFEVATVNKSVLSTSLGTCSYLTFPTRMDGSILRCIRGERQPWHNMHMTDPPCTEATLCMSIEVGDNSHLYISVDVTDSRGITVGALLDESLSRKDVTVYKMPGRPRSVLGQQTVRSFLLERERETGASFPSWGRLLIELPGMVLPTDEMREEVYTRRPLQPV